MRRCNDFLGVKSIRFDHDKSHLIIDDQTLSISYASNQFYLLDALFSNPKKRWENDELLEISASSYGVPAVTYMLPGFHHRAQSRRHPESSVSVRGERKQPPPVVAVHGPRARAHGPGWAGFFLQAHAMSPWAHAISLCGLRLGQI